MKNWLRGALYIGCIFFTTENHLMASQAHCPMPTKTKHTSTATIDVKDFTLKDGQPVWFTTDPELDVITIGLCFQYAGTQADPKDKPGLSSFLVAMLDEGAGPYDSQAFKKKLIEKNVKLSISINQDNITVVFKTTSANISEAFNLIKLALTEPCFTSDAHIRTQKQMTASLMQSLHKPEAIAKEKMIAAILGDDHVYAKNTEKQLSALPNFTKKDLEAHLKQHITQANLKIAAAGNISETTLKSCLEDLISAFPKGNKITQTANEKLLNSGKIIHVEMNVPQATIMFAHPGVARNDPDFYATYLLVQTIGGNAFESRLWKEVREKRGLAYYISLGLFSQKLQYGMIGATGIKTTSVQEVIKLIKEHWKNVAENGVTPAELTLQKQFLNESYPLSFTKTSDIVSALLSYQNENLSKNYINEREALFNQVSAEDIKRVAKRLLKKNDLTFLIVGKKE
jgi:zinc protease